MKDKRVKRVKKSTHAIVKKACQQKESLLGVDASRRHKLANGPIVRVFREVAHDVRYVMKVQQRVHQVLRLHDKHISSFVYCDLYEIKNSVSKRFEVDIRI
jgi:hypothetical protein